MSMILGVPFLEFIQRTNVLVAIILAVIGVVLACLAKRITRAVRKTDVVKEEDTILVVTKILGLVFILVGLVLMVLEF